MKKFLPTLLCSLLVSGAVSAQKRERAVTTDAPQPVTITRPSIVEEKFDRVISALRGDIFGTDVYICGSITDFEGVPIRGAHVMMFDVNSNTSFSTSSTSFGRYVIKGVTNGGSYVMSVNHRRYLFVMGSVFVEVFDDPVSVNFQAQEIKE